MIITILKVIEIYWVLNSQNAFKEFLGAKDIQPCVDFNDLNALKQRLIEILALSIAFIVLNITGMNWNAFLKIP